ncbi:unnamed protein product, partial [Mesorhabditis spiculigera]
MNEPMDEGSSSSAAPVAPIGPEIFMLRYSLTAKEAEVHETFKSAAHRRNTGDRSARSIPALEALGLRLEDYVKTVVTPAYIFFLLKDGRVLRLGYSVENRSVSPPTRHPNAKATSASGSVAFAAPKSKFSSTGLVRFSPASDVPEDLIAQAQVVLQGKSREVIVRELQRTNLNVNEAVNNLLSKDDDEDDDDAIGEVCIPEELLAVLDAQSMQLGGHEDYAPDLESAFMLQRGRAARRDAAHDKNKDKKNQSSYSEFTYDDKVGEWQAEDTEEAARLRFSDITACASEILGLAGGVVYGWSFTSQHGSSQPHSRASEAVGGSTVVRLISSYLRAAVLYEKPTREGVVREMASWLDPYLLPGKIGTALIQSLPAQPQIDRKAQGADVHFFCSDYFAGFITQNGYLHWCGVVPAAEKVHNFGKMRNKARKNWSRDSQAESEIAVGVEVRPKTSPLYEPGSVAVLLKDGQPRVGVLMEKVWSASETCRFRLIDEDKYSLDLAELQKEPLKAAAAPNNDQLPGSRKRRANDSNEPNYQEPWPISDCIFLYEQPHENVWIVVLHDKESKQCVTVDPRDPTWKDVPREEISVAHPKFKESRHHIRQVAHLQVRGTDDTLAFDSPKCMEPKRVTVRLPISYDRLCNAVADEKGIRCLVCSDGLYQLIRLSVTGKVLSKHSLPLTSSSVFASKEDLALEDMPIQPELVNFSKEDMVFIRSKPGSALILMWRDAEGGFRELSTYHQPLSPLQSLWIGQNVDEPVKNASVIILGLGPPTNGNLLQAVLDCDEEADPLTTPNVSSASTTTRITFVAPTFTDIGGNVLHAAVALATSATNRDQADKGEEGAEGSKTMDQRWSRLLRSSSDSKRAAALAALGGLAKEKEQAEAGIKFPNEARQRQLSAMEIVKQLVQLPSKDLLEQMLKHKLDTLLEPPPNWFAPPEHSKSWPLFVLCYNDTCSFTWTGQDHINQDIFECRTCGLTGTLCCCTECAFTCHKGHDCSLKRTSPTAYCDCWEKCPCKALVAGNPEARLYLLKELLEKTDCYKFPNQNGQHIVYFLAKTIARQATEQLPWQKKIRPKSMIDNDAEPNTPEQNLEPPNFATKALNACLSNLDVVRHFASEQMNDGLLDKGRLDDIGNVAYGQRVRSEDLDATIFLMLTKCPTEYLNTLTHTLIKGLAKDHDSTAALICRLVRSILRIYVLLVNLSSTAAMVAAHGLFSTKQFTVEKDEKKSEDRFIIVNYRSLTGRGKSQELKPEIIIEAVSRSHKFLKCFLAYTSLEAAQMAAASIAPVLVGRARTVVPMSARPKETDVFNVSLDIIYFENLWTVLCLFSVDRNHADEVGQWQGPFFGRLAAKDPYRDTTESEQSDAETEDRRPASNRLLSTSSNLGPSTTAENANDGAGQAITESTGRHAIVLSTNSARVQRARSISYTSEDDTENEDNDDNDNENDDQDREGEHDDDQDENHGDEQEDQDMDDDDHEDMEIIDFDQMPSRAAIRTGIGLPPESDESDDDETRQEGQPPPPPNAGDEVRNAEQGSSSNDTNTNQVLNRLGSGAAAETVRPDVQMRRDRRRAIARRRHPSGIVNRFRTETMGTSGTMDTTADEAEKKPNEPKEPPATSISDSSRHLCSAFYVLARMAYEVEMVSAGTSLTNNSMNFIDECLAPAWRWLVEAMDATERQIKLAKARQQDLDVEPQALPQHLHEVPTVSAYFVDLMRTASGEQGEKFPTLDSALLRPLTLVADIFLARCRTLDLVQSLLSGVTEEERQKTAFFERGLEFCYPGIVQKADNSVSTEQWRLASNPLLLTPKYSRPNFYQHDSLKMTADQWNGFYADKLNLKIPEGGSNPPAYWTRASGLVVKQDIHILLPKPEPSLGLDCDATLNLLEVRAESRWATTLECLARNYHQDIFSICGQEFFSQKVFDNPGQATCRELVIEKLSRSHDKLVRSTVYQLNAQFTRRLGQKTAATPPLFTHKIKVGFENEPGEGSGVARAFYSALGEALMSLKNLPFEDLGWDNNEEFLYGGAPPEASPQKPSRSMIDYFGAIDEPSLIGRRFQLLPTRSSRKLTLKLASAPYTPQRIAEPAPNVIDDSLTIRQVPDLADKLFNQVQAQYPQAAERITGLLVDMPVQEGVRMNINKDGCFRERLQEAVDLLKKGDAADRAMFESQAGEETTSAQEPVVPKMDTAPLFYQPSADQPVFALSPGAMSPIRSVLSGMLEESSGSASSSNMFSRCACRATSGRSFSERPTSFHDLAFVDKELYNQLRTLIADLSGSQEGLAEKLDALQLDFSPTTIELCPNGGQQRVTAENSQEYVHEIVKCRLTRDDLMKCYQSLQQGISDVIPSGYLAHLSPEDMTLLVNGIAEMDMGRLKRLTAFTDECRISPGEIETIRKWFWETVDRLSEREKQDLVFFWTGSATLPALDELFVPRPSIVIRSLSDAHLPSANTCISRIYLPQYSSKKILAPSCARPSKWKFSASFRCSFPSFIIIIELPASVQQRLVVFATQVDQSLVTLLGAHAIQARRPAARRRARDATNPTPRLDPESALHRPARRGHIADEHCPAARLRGPAGRLVRALRVGVDFRTIAEAVIMVSRVAAQPICLLILNPADSFKKNHLLNCFANR